MPQPDLWRTDGQAFYRLSSTGSDPNIEGPGDRCFGLLRMPTGFTMWDLHDSKPLQGWTEGLLVVEPGIPIDDAPWNTKDELVVSNRLRELLEFIAPGQAQYLPMSLKRARWEVVDMSKFVVHEEGAEMIGGPGDYWMMNTLVEVDCMDWKLAKSSPWRSAIDVAKVPGDVQLFRIADQRSVVYCRRRVREVCVEAGIRGLQFREVLYTPEPG
ncbi:MAG: hypothetical protein JSR77_13125 [Planctomycetes bacterium]|nr:hypothetical protein [Planctomycetota bacterium]